MAVLMLLRSCLAPARRRPIHPAGPVALYELGEAVEEQQHEAASAPNMKATELASLDVVDE